MNGNGTVLMPAVVMDRKFSAPEHDLDYVLDRRDALTAMLEALPPKHEEAVRFFYFTDLAQEDIAWFLGASPERARQILEDAEAMMQGIARTCFPHLCANGGVR